MGPDESSGKPQPFDEPPRWLSYSEVNEALKRLVGTHVSVSIGTEGGPEVASLFGWLLGGTAYGYGGESTSYLLAEEERPQWGHRLPPTPSFVIHRMRGFRGMVERDRVGCVFGGVHVSVEPTDPLSLALLAERTQR